MMIRRKSVSCVGVTIAALLAAAASVLQASPYSDAVQALNPDAYYRLDGSDGSGSDETGTHDFDNVEGGIAFRVPGPRPADGFPGMDVANNAWDFSSGLRSQVTDYIPAAGQEPRTLIGWFNTDVTQAQHGGPIDLFGWSADINARNTFKGWNLKVQTGIDSDAGTSLGFDVVALNVIGREVQAKTTPINLGQWHMVGVIYEGGPIGTAKVFIDGVFQELINDVSVTPADPGPDPTPYGFHIGRDLGGFAMDGQVDNLAVWSRPLRSLDVIDLYETAALGAPPNPPSQPGTGGPWTVFPLRGHSEFVFASAVPPEAITAFNAHLDMVANRQFGNGIDVFFAPASYLIPQYDSVAARGLSAVVWHGAGPFPGVFATGNPGMSDEQKLILQKLDQPGAPAPVHFGEWGYTFHNLLGIGVKGYATVPTTKQQAYSYLKSYFQERNDTYDGRFFSVTGHSHYESYAAEWGAQAVGLELGENIRFSQSKMAFARGASRQWDIPWSVQVSAWFHGSLTTAGPLTGGPGNARGIDAGHSHSLFERLWHHAWFAGAAQVTPEGGGFYLFEEGGAAPYTFTTLGEIADDFYDLTLTHDRGVPYTPLAIVLDRYAGYNGFESNPWGVLPKTADDQQLLDLFQQQLFPGSADSNNPNAPNPEAPYLVATPYGEAFDVLLSTAQADKLSTYPEVLLVGDIGFDSGFVDELEAAVSSGSRLLISQTHASSLGSDLARLQAAGAVEILSSWVNPNTGRAAAISNARLDLLAEEHLPIHVSGDPVQFQVNQNSEGWVIEVINNAGVTKIPHLPAVIDPAAIANVTLTPLVDVIAAYDWTTDAQFNLDSASIDIAIGPGQVSYIQFVIPQTADFDYDGDVDGSDFLTWQRGLGLAGQLDNSNGDADGSGLVDELDLVHWQDQFALGDPLQEAFTAVPEPASNLLIVVAGAMGAASSRKCLRLPDATNRHTRLASHPTSNHC